MRPLILILILLLAPVSALTQVNELERFSQHLSSQWAKDGVVVASGFDRAGHQNLSVLAWQGYFPLQTTAQAGVPTTLRIYTNRTYDCSRALLLPDLKKRIVLGPRGVQEVALPAMAKGQVLYGTCAMGMYDFKIVFQ